MLRRGLALAAAIVLADQATKWWILDLFVQGGMGERIMRVAPILDIVLVWNRGVSFGLFNNDGFANAAIFSTLAAVIVCVLAVWLYRAANPLIATGIGLIIGGAIGNVIDRLRFGAVVDFLYFHAGPYYFPAFNVADAAITIGVGLLLLDGLLSGRQAPTKGS